jgi:NAD(P)-dependent dehydrogenase (short-subunit alcohol dehydrogenase family)
VPWGSPDPNGVARAPHARVDSVCPWTMRGRCVTSTCSIQSRTTRSRLTVRFAVINNLGSIHSAAASPFTIAYVAAKHGLLGLSKIVALETARTDVTISTICPSYAPPCSTSRSLARRRSMVSGRMK